MLDQKGEPGEGGEWKGQVSIFSRSSFHIIRTIDASGRRINFWVVLRRIIAIFYFIISR